MSTPCEKERRVSKQDVVHMYSRILHTHKNNKTESFAETQMDLESVLKQ